MDVNMLNNVPTFIMKLWKMLESKNSDVSDIMLWSPSGTSFIIKNKITFITKLLPMYFKHNNMGSFVRQLNLYDFHKIYARVNNNELEYQHKYFRKGAPEMLHLIKRKLPRASRMVATTQDSMELSTLTKELSAVKTKQDKIMRQMTCLQRDNLNLLKDLKGLHVRQNNQTQVLTNILETLIPYVQNRPGTSSEGDRNNELEEAGSLFNTDEDIIGKLNAIKHVNQEEIASTSNALLSKNTSDFTLMRPSETTNYANIETADMVTEDPVDDLAAEVVFDVVEDVENRAETQESQNRIDEISRWLEGDETSGVKFEIDDDNTET